MSPSGQPITVGLPAETKDRERRIALTPSAVGLLVARGHRVLVERGAGTGAGFSDDTYTVAGAQLTSSAEEAWGADLVVKVKEPQRDEYRHFRDDLALFTYLHLAAEPELTATLLTAGTAGYAYETLTDRGLPLLAPMSEVAGRAAAVIGAAQLSTANGGSGTLPGGAAGVPPARAVVIGMGVAGTLAARGLRGLDMHVTGVDVDLERLYRHRMDGTVDATQVSEPDAVGALVAEADLVVGAALVPGALAPKVVSEAHVMAMRAGSVVLDLAIDQGGCIETARPTSLSASTYVLHEVVHYCVTNVPGQFPRTASAALSAAVLPRAAILADHVAASRSRASGPASHLDVPAGLAGALNVADGRIVHAAVAAAFPHLPAVTAAGAGA